MAAPSPTKDQVLSTWQHFRNQRPNRVLHDRWPTVPPTLEGVEACQPGLTSPLTPVQRWMTAIAAYDEVRVYLDLDTLLRRSVELLREAIGLERAAIFLLESPERLRGTFGTGRSGESTDERHIAFDVGNSHRQAFTLTHEGLAQWARFSGVPLFAQHQDQTVVVRTGENIIVPVPGQRGCWGLIACDWGLSGTATNTDTLLRAAVFARILGPALERLQQDLPSIARWQPLAVPFHSPQDTTGIVGEALRRLRIDPNQDRTDLARSLGTTADRLGRVFKGSMGESLQEYRNRLRLERFLAIVDPDGGNLLAAALDAGFGSYAQFHRVFRRTYNRSPIEHLRARGK